MTFLFLLPRRGVGSADPLCCNRQHRRPQHHVGTLKLKLILVRLVRTLRQIETCRLRGLRKQIPSRLIQYPTIKGEHLREAMAAPGHNGQPARPQIQPCRYKTGKTLGAGSYSVVKECVHIDTGRYYAAKVINKRMMAGREHMVGLRQREALGNILMLPCARCGMRSQC